MEDSISLPNDEAYQNEPQEIEFGTMLNPKCGKCPIYSPWFRMFCGITRFRPCMHFGCFRSIYFRFPLEMIQDDTASQTAYEFHLRRT